MHRHPGMAGNTPGHSRTDTPGHTGTPRDGHIGTYPARPSGDPNTGQSCSFGHFSTLLPLSPCCARIVLVCVGSDVFWLSGLAPMGVSSGFYTF